MNTNDIYKVGDILSMSWGYDQTNVDFFRVKELKGRTMVVLQPVKLKVKEVEAYGSMSGEYRYDPESYEVESYSVFIKDPEKGRAFKIRDGGAGRGVYIDYHYLRPYKGERVYESWYA